MISIELRFSEVIPELLYLLAISSAFRKVLLIIEIFWAFFINNASTTAFADPPDPNTTQLSWLRLFNLESGMLFLKPI